jgi:hypothetical protein
LRYDIDARRVKARHERRRIGRNSALECLARFRGLLFLLADETEANPRRSELRV